MRDINAKDRFEMALENKFRSVIGNPELSLVRLEFDPIAMDRAGYIAYRLSGSSAGISQQPYYGADNAVPSVIYALRLVDKGRASLAVNSIHRQTHILFDESVIPSVDRTLFRKAVFDFYQENGAQVLATEEGNIPYIVRTLKGINLLEDGKGLDRSKDHDRWHKEYRWCYLELVTKIPENSMLIVLEDILLCQYKITLMDQ